MRRRRRRRSTRAASGAGRSPRGPPRRRRASPRSCRGAAPEPLEPLEKARRMASICGPSRDANSESAAGDAASPSRSARSRFSADAWIRRMPRLPATPLIVCATRSAALRSPRSSAPAISPAAPACLLANCSSRLRKSRALPATRASPSAASTPSIAGRSAGGLDEEGAGLAGRLSADSTSTRHKRLHPALERRVESVRVDGLGHVVVHSGVQAALAFFHRRVGGHGDDRELRKARIRADLGRRLEAVHFGHLEIHQNDVVRRRERDALEHPDGLPSVVGDRDPGPDALEKLDGDLLVDEVVLGQQDPDAPEPVRWRGFAGRAPGDLASSGFRREDRDERVDQHGLRDGLQQEARDVELLGLLAHLFPAERRHHDHGRRLAEGRIALDPPRRLQPVDARHPPVHEDDVVGTGGVVLLHGRDRLLARSDDVHAIADVLQGVCQDVAGGGIVVGDQHGQMLQLARVEPAARRLGAEAQPGGEEKRAPHAGLALEPDLAAHQLHQPLADRQPETGAPVLAGRRHVGLGEGLEEARRLLRRHAGARVPDRKAQLDPLAGLLEQLRLQPDLAPFGELHGVVDEVRQDLAEAQGVAPQALRHRGRGVGQELEALLVRLLSGHGRDRRDHFVELERRRLEVELPRLDLREIQDVVDDPEQRCPGVVDLADVVPLLGSHRGLQREVREADDRVHRSPDLVAHVGEEHGLQLRGFLGLLPRSRELDLLRFELPCLFLGLAEELLRPEVAGQDLEAHPDDRQQLVEERLLVSGERSKRRELEDREELVLGRHRPGGRLGRSRLADARHDAQSVRGDAREARRLALPRALTRERFSRSQPFGSPRSQPVARDAAQPLVLALTLDRDRRPRHLRRGPGRASRRGGTRTRRVSWRSGALR